MAKCFVSASHIYLTESLFKRQLLASTLRKGHARLTISKCSM